MPDTFKLACVQLNSGNEVAANIVHASEWIRRAAGAGADLIATPETTGMIESRRQAALEKAQFERDHSALSAFRELAAETGRWLLIGSLSVKVEGEERIANRSFLIDGSGTVVARYDKIHMFDVDLPSGETYRESKTYRPGSDAVLTATPWGILGMTVCYDVRFPNLYRSLAKAGADFLSVPSAFTKVTGQAHWHLLLRARAVETGCFVFAPAQCGSHPGDRQTFGHSLIVDPWGEVLADGGEEPGYVMAEIDRSRVDEVRGRVPSLSHDRLYSAPQPIAGSEAAE
jgi:predicted amidohydrolase